MSVLTASKARVLPLKTNTTCVSEYVSLPKLENKWLATSDNFTFKFSLQPPQAPSNYYFCIGLLFIGPQ